MSTHGQEDAMSLSFNNKDDIGDQITNNNNDQHASNMSHDQDQENLSYSVNNINNNNILEESADGNNIRIVARNKDATYRAAENVLRGVSNLSNGLGSTLIMNNNDPQNYNDKNAIIYANIDCSHEAALANLMNHQSSISSSFGNYHNINDTNNTIGQQESQHFAGDQQVARLNGNGPRSKVGATIAMMNSLAAQSNNNNQNTTNPLPSGPTMGALNGAMRQHQFSSQQKHQQNNIFPSQPNRKLAPPKPPKPIIQQASRFYQQAAAAATTTGNSNTNQGTFLNRHAPGRLGTPTRDELAAEYSRLAFPERAEL